MNDLSSVLIGNEFNISFNESLKQSQSFDFESGISQTIGTKSVPMMIIDIAYRSISKSQFDEIDGSYQNNHSNTFLVNLGDNFDARILYDRPNNGVFAFGDFSFETSIDEMNKGEKRYTGKVTLITSVLFNYQEFVNMYDEPSKYNPNITTNTDFLDILDILSPQKVMYGYDLNKRFTNLGQSISTQRDLGNSKKTWKLDFLAQESQWLELLTFYRKKGSIGLFGIPEQGYYNTTDQLINVRFLKDSLSYQKVIGNVYIMSFELIEVK